MPLPLIPLIAGAVEAALAGVSVSGLIGAAQASIAALLAAEAVSDWWDSNTGAALMADQLNKRLAAAGVELEFPPFNPLFESGRAVFKKTIEAYALDRLNTRAGTSFAAVADLTPENFNVELGRILAAPINAATGSNFSTVWPVEKLKDQLHTEVVRQFDNRGRYAAGALFKPGTLDGIKASIAAKHPELMARVAEQKPGGMWGPPKDQAHAIRREKARVRQAKYRRTHQQVWTPK